MPSQLFATKFFNFIYLVLGVIMSKFKLLNNTIMIQLTGFTGENQELEECEIRNLIGVDSFVVSGD